MLRCFCNMTSFILVIIKSARWIMKIDVNSINRVIVFVIICNHSNTATNGSRFPVVTGSCSDGLFKLRSNAMIIILVEGMNSTKISNNKMHTHTILQHKMINYTKHTC